MNSGEELAKKAYNKAINNIRENCKVLEKFIGQDLQIENKKDFLEFADRVGDINLARSFVRIKFGNAAICNLDKEDDERT